MLGLTLFLQYILHFSISYTDFFVMLFPLLELLPRSATMFIISGQIVSELPAGSNWNFDVHWYPKIPGVISASSFDGKIGIYNVEVCAKNADLVLKNRTGQELTMNIRDK